MNNITLLKEMLKDLRAEVESFEKIERNKLKLEERLEILFKMYRCEGRVDAIEMAIDLLQENNKLKRSKE